MVPVPKDGVESRELDRETPPLQATKIYNCHMPKFDPQNTPSGHLHHRRSIRLKGYDYSSAGAYYVTIAAWQREFLFGEIVNKEMRLNKLGKIVEWEWLELPKRFSYIELGAYMVMPNHFHGIIFIVERRGTVPVPEDDGANEISNDNDKSSEIQGGETPPLRTYHPQRDPPCSPKSDWGSSDLGEAGRVYSAASL